MKQESSEKIFGGFQKMISPFTSSRQVAVATRLGYFGGGRGALRSEKFHKFSDLFEALRITAI
jgi:hypothetical protein